MVNRTGYHWLKRFTQKRLNWTNAQDQQAGTQGGARGTDYLLYTRIESSRSRYRTWLRIESASITQNKCVYEALREIEYKGWELTLKIPYSGRLESTSITQNNCTSHLVGNRAPDPLWHLRIPSRARQRQIELAPDCSILPRTVTNLSPIFTNRYETPLASTNTLTSPPGEYRELAPNCHTIKETPPGHL